MRGPEDQITIRVLDAEEIDNQPVRVDFSGFLRLPLVGRMQAGGLRINQLATELVRELKKYIRDPRVVVSVTEFRSMGAVKNFGVHQVQGRKTLLEMISLAGGIDPARGKTAGETRRGKSEAGLPDMLRRAGPGLSSPRTRCVPHLGGSNVFSVFAYL